MLDYLESFYSVECIWSNFWMKSIVFIDCHTTEDSGLRSQHVKMFQKHTCKYFAEFPMPGKV